MCRLQFADRTQECADACTKLALSVDVVKTGMFYWYIVKKYYIIVSFPLRVADKLRGLCTEKVGGHMPWALTRDDHIVMRDSWSDAFIEIERKVVADPPHVDTVVDLLLKELDAYI